MKRDLWLALGAVGGSLVGQLLRRLLNGKPPAETSQQAGLLRASVGGPGAVMAATGLSRRASEALELDPEDPRAQAAVGFVVGLALTVLSGPIRRLLPPA